MSEPVVRISQGFSVPKPCQHEIIDDLRWRQVVAHDETALYDTAAQAEADGFPGCHRCHPLAFMPVIGISAME